MLQLAQKTARSLHIGMRRSRTIRTNWLDFRFLCCIAGCVCTRVGGQEHERTYGELFILTHITHLSDRDDEDSLWHVCDWPLMCPSRGSLSITFPPSRCNPQGGHLPPAFAMIKGPSRKESEESLFTYCVCVCASFIRQSNFVVCAI